MRGKALAGVSALGVVKLIRLASLGRVACHFLLIDFLSNL